MVTLLDALVTVVIPSHIGDITICLRLMTTVLLLHNANDQNTVIASDKHGSAGTILVTESLLFYALFISLFQTIFTSLNIQSNSYHLDNMLPQL